MLWILLTFVPLVPLAIFGAHYIARPMRWPLVLLAGGSLVVPIFVGYVYSADILKFSAVALFTSGILAGAALNALAETQGGRWKALFGACLILTVMSAAVGITGILSAQFKHVAALSTYYEGPVELGSDDRAAVAWLRRRVSPDEIIYRTPDVSLGYMEFGGLPSTPTIIGSEKQFGLPESRTVAMQELLKELPSDLRRIGPSALFGSWSRRTIRGWSGMF